MKITGTKCYINVERNGRTAIFGGELGIDGFYAIKDSMRWLYPDENLIVTEVEKNELVNAVLEEVKNYKDKVFFS